MRKAFEGLYGLVRDRLLCEPRSGHVFVFCNAQRNRLKFLFFDGSGLWVCAKRLERGGFAWPQTGDSHGKIVLSHEELSLVIRWNRSSPDTASAVVSRGNSGGAFHSICIVLGCE
jgi:transposase